MVDNGRDPFVDFQHPRTRLALAGLGVKECSNILTSPLRFSLSSWVYCTSYSDPFHYRTSVANILYLLLDKCWITILGCLRGVCQIKCLTFSNYVYHQVRAFTTFAS